MLPKTSLTLALALVLASATSATAASAPAACTIEVIQPRITTAIVATMPLRVQWMVTPTNASAQLPNDATVAVELMRYGLVVANKPLGRPQSFATIAGNASVPALPVLTDQPMTTVYETQAKMPKFQNWMSNNAAYFVRFVVSAPRAEVDAWRGVNASSNADAGAYAPVELCSADSSRFMIMSKA